MIRATASTARLRSTAQGSRARRAALVPVLVATAFALVSGVVVGPGAAAAELDDDELRVSAAGVAFEPSRWTDELAYVVRPAGSGRGGQAFTRRLSRDEQRAGWAAFWEAHQRYPDGYCVVWVEVEDTGTWHDPGQGSACTAAPPPTAQPTPAPTATTSRPTPAPTPEPGRPEPTPTPDPTPAASKTPSPTPTPSASATPSPSASPSATSTPSPSPSRALPTAALMEGIPPQQPPPARTQAGAVEEHELISPLGWVAVLGTGAGLTAGGLLLLWRRLT